MCLRFDPRVAFCALAVTALALETVPAQSPLGAAFTYQGHLKSNGSPVNGVVNVDFTLWNDPTATDPGNQVGSIQSIAGAVVSSGLFTVQLNGSGEFGATAFNGDKRWLEFTVNGTTLAPRQELTAAPYAQTAIRAQSCGVADYANAPWVPSGADLYYSSGKVGIGTSTPAAQLDVIGTGKMDSFLLPTGAAPGKVLTSNGSGNGTWQDNAGPKLPYSGTASVDGNNLLHYRTRVREAASRYKSTRPPRMRRQSSARFRRPRLVVRRLPCAASITEPGPQGLASGARTMAAAPAFTGRRSPALGCSPAERLGFMDLVHQLGSLATVQAQAETTTV